MDFQPAVFEFISKSAGTSRIGSTTCLSYGDTNLGGLLFCCLFFWAGCGSQGDQPAGSMVTEKTTAALPTRSETVEIEKINHQEDTERSNPVKSKDPGTETESGNGTTTGADKPLDSNNEIGTNDHRETDTGEPGNPSYTNRLAKETSPYLLLHAHNPVDWMPWGEDALQMAKRDNKLIFLSIGYSSCHWCHVMERESFVNADIAKFLNKNFVCIKVDREERPDVDTVYMTALQVYFQLVRSPQNGGWPLSMFLTPDARPFAGGTYFPPDTFREILNTLYTQWTDDAGKIEEIAKVLTRLSRQQLELPSEGQVVSLNQSAVDRGLKELIEKFDAEHGGFGFNPTDPQIPKFPEPSNLLFLINRARQIGRQQDEGASTDGSSADHVVVTMLNKTLTQMQIGGLWDHVGGGFHRYSVDRFWHIPHFEKMLYDNGQLATVYAEAHALTGRDDYRRVVIALLDFVLREMTQEEGGFYAALDAESEGVEGKYYRWSREEVQTALPADGLALFTSVYGLDGSPNFEDHYALQLSRPLAETAQEHDLEESALEDTLEAMRDKLLHVRSERPRPLTDTKVLTSWNGLMIRGFADAGRILERPQYVEAAERAAQFVLNYLIEEDGRLLRTYGMGTSKLNAYLNDYAFLVDGLIALHRCNGDDQWLQTANQVTQKQIELFWDDQRGGFYFTSNDHESLIARSKNPVDGAEPSGNSVAAQNLIYLADALDEPLYLEKARQTIDSVAGMVDRSPAAAPRLLIALSELLDREGTD